MKSTLHTSLSKEAKNWLKNEAHQQNKNICDVIEEIISFYKNNKELPDKYKHAEFYLKDIIRVMLEEEIKKKNTKRCGYRYLPPEK